jgi:phage tail-like protein
MPHGVPFTTFNFKVLLSFPNSLSQVGAALNVDEMTVCRGEFSDCDGLEMTMAPKTIREGGNNGRMIHLSGPVSYGQLSLKRGMTENTALWRWFEMSQRKLDLRADGKILMLAPDRRAKQARFSITGCMPVKIKAPSLSAKDGLIAIEEMQIAYETLTLDRHLDLGDLVNAVTS